MTDALVNGFTLGIAYLVKKPNKKQKNKAKHEYSWDMLFATK